MAIRVREIAGSEEGFEGLDAASDKRVYRVFDPADPEPSISAMRAAVLATAPSSVGSLQLDKLSREFDGPGRSWIWTADYNWKAPESSLRWSFGTQGGTVKVTHSRSTTPFVASGTAPNFNSGIGYSGGELQGVDIVVPALKLTATYRWPAGAFTVADAKALAGYTGATNSATWQTFAAGELLFLGASAEIVSGKPTEVTYEFAASANVTGLTIGSIASISKAGHAYLWVLWEDTEDATAKKLVKSPLAVYVEQVYPSIAFSSFGIG